MDARVAARYRAALGRAFDGESRPVIRPGPPDGPEQPPNKPPRVDLRPFMSPVENQGPLMSCTANAVMGLIDYLQIATTGTYLDGSRLFLYKATRDLLHLAGDSGAYVRSALKALALFGSCPEDYYPYYPPAFDQEPDAFCYSLAARFRGIAYYRLQGRVAELRASIAQGFPVCFGFSCYESMDDPDVAETGIIPYPVPDERVIGGHAVLAVGYIDTPGEEQAGYFIIRNSWGPDWGIDGYGLLPYEYVERHPRGEALADDFWTLTQMTFVDLPGTRAAPYAMANWDEPRRQENP